MNTCCECCLLMLWARDLSAAIGDPRVIRDILVQRARNPNKISEKDFFRECAWAVYTSGVKMRTVEQRWSQVEIAFLHWDYEEVVMHEATARGAAMRVVVWNYRRKVDAVIRIAQWMHQEGWDTIRNRLQSGLERDTQGNHVPAPNTISYLDQLPMIGETNALFVLKNVGYDVAKPDRVLKHLAAEFGYTRDAGGVQQFALDISRLVLERVSVVETVLWNTAGSESALSFTCPSCGTKRD